MTFYSSDDCGDNSDEMNCAGYTMCNFEEPFGMCSWKQDADNNIDWELGDGGTPSFQTGPKRDHTLGLPSGHFMFIEASYPAVLGDLARIASPVLNSTGNSCEFRFFYHMYGEVSVRSHPQQSEFSLLLSCLACWCSQCLHSNNRWWTNEQNLLERLRNR